MRPDAARAAADRLDSGPCGSAKARGFLPDSASAMQGKEYRESVRAALRGSTRTPKISMLPRLHLIVATMIVALALMWLGISLFSVPRTGSVFAVGLRSAQGWPIERSLPEPPDWRQFVARSALRRSEELSRLLDLPAGAPATEEVRVEAEPLAAPVSTAPSRMSEPDIVATINRSVAVDHPPLQLALPSPPATPPPDVTASPSASPAPDRDAREVPASEPASGEPAGREPAGPPSSEPAGREPAGGDNAVVALAPTAAAAAEQAVVMPRPKPAASRVHRRANVKSRARARMKTAQATRAHAVRTPPAQPATPVFTDPFSQLLR